MCTAMVTGPLPYSCIMLWVIFYSTALSLCLIDLRYVCHLLQNGKYVPYVRWPEKVVSSSGAGTQGEVARAAGKVERGSSGDQGGRCIRSGGQ
jgi:hypothetical protein